MHPIEHLRYVARSGGSDVASLAREAAVALGTMRADPANLVIACRRIVERHPVAGPLWWMCSHLLLADDPTGLAWELADRLADDPTPRAVAAAVPDGATVATIGWPAVAGAALARRGDVRVLCADSRFDGSGFVRMLERCEVECDTVPPESLAHAVRSADLVMIEALAASPRRVIAPVGSHVLAAVAASVGTPVWLVAGVGRRLPVEYVEAIATAVDVRAAGLDVDVDDLPVVLATHLATDGGIDDLPGPGLLAVDCPVAHELLRSSPF